MTGMTINDCDWGENEFSDAVVNGINYGDLNDQWEAMGMSAAQFMTTWSYKNRDLHNCVVPSNSFDSSYDFADFNLAGAYFFRISNAQFVKSRIADATFQYCDLTNCAFDDAVLYGNRFSNCKIDLKRWSSAASFTFSGVEFAGVEFSGPIDFSGRNLVGGALNSHSDFHVNFENAKINGFVAKGGLDGANIHVTKSYKTGNLSEVRISTSDLSGADFSGQLLANSKFWRCDFTNCKFDDAVITASSFKECTGLTREQIESTWNFKHGHMTDIELPNRLFD
ncbi:pentapeptide repeat-containing protein [Novipirellula herctigrandis]